MSQPLAKNVFIATVTLISGASPGFCADGQAAIDMLIGNTIHGISESKVNEYYMFFSNDGVARVFYRNLNKRDQGTWRAQDGKLCLNLHDNPAECFDIIVSDDDVSIGTKDMAMPLRAKMTKGNSQNL